MGLPWCIFEPGYKCWTIVILEHGKMIGLLINRLTSNNGFSYRNVFQSCINVLSKIINHCCQKVKVCVFRTIWSSFHLHVVQELMFDFRLPMSASAHQIPHRNIDFSSKFDVKILSCYWFWCWHSEFKISSFTFMLVEFKQSHIVQTTQKFELFLTKNRGF